MAKYRPTLDALKGMGRPQRRRKDLLRAKVNDEVTVRNAGWEAGRVARGAEGIAVVANANGRAVPVAGRVAVRRQLSALQKQTSSV